MLENQGTPRSLVHLWRLGVEDLKPWVDLGPHRLSMCAFDMVELLCGSPGSYVQCLSQAAVARLAPAVTSLKVVSSQATEMKVQ